MNPNDIPRAKIGLSGLFSAKKNHSIFLPESMVASVPEYQQYKQPNVDGSSSSALHLTVSSRVQMPTKSPTEPFRYGVIRWIGEIPPMQGLVAGIEMVSAKCVYIILLVALVVIFWPIVLILGCTCIPYLLEYKPGLLFPS